MSRIDPARFDGVVRTALDDAARRATGPVDTRDVLVALIRGDAKGEWDRVALYFTDENAIRRAQVVDPAPGPLGRWGAAALTTTCTDALETAVELADRYDTRLVSVGLAAIALVAKADSAAAGALTGGDPSLRAQLLDVLQDAIVGGGLAHLDLALREIARDRRRRDAGPAEAGRGRRVRTRRTIPAEPGGADRVDADDLALLTTVLSDLDDSDLRLRYERMCLSAESLESVRAMAAADGFASAATVVERAKDRFDTDQPDPRQIVVAAMTRPSAGLAKAVHLLGLSPRDVALEAALADADAHRVGDKVSDATAFYTTLTGLASVLTSVLIGRHVVLTHDWWPGLPVAVLFISLAWNGRPSVELTLAALLWWWDGPVLAGVALLSAAAGILMHRSERINALYRTGILVPARSWRHHVYLRSSVASLQLTQLIRYRSRSRMAQPEEGR